MVTVRGSGEEGRESLAGTMTEVLSVYRMSAIMPNMISLDTHQMLDGELRDSDETV